MKANDNPKKIYDFLKKNLNKDYCDDCLQKQTGVDRHQVNTIASSLGLFPKEFVRKEGVCPHGCARPEKLVTRAI